MKTLLRLALLLVALGGLAHADNILMARIQLPADLALEYVKTSVAEHGYTVAHIQLCDGGLADFGYKSDIYRVVFFGKIDEVRRITADHPDLVSYLPLKMTVVAEKGETLLSVINPAVLGQFYADSELQIQLQRWTSDLHSIIDDVHKAAAHHAALKQ